MISEKHIKYVLVFVLSIATLSGSLAQKFPSDKFQNLKIRNVGPANMSGRITAIAAVADTPTKIIYIGAASGGVWKSENGGTAWESIFDDNPTVNIGAIAVQQSNPSVVWVGTGEGNPRNSMNLGLGLFKSLDAGKTWKRMGLENSKAIHRIIVDPTDGNTVYVGVMGDPFTPHTERGLYKTTDGGLTWKKILYTNAQSGIADLVMDPANPNKLLAAMYEHRRNPYSFTSGGPGSGLYMTYDGGESWKRLSEKEGMPPGELGRIGLAVAPSNPDRIYAKVEAAKNALYRSDDGGLSWKMINDNPRFTNNRPFYFQELAVDTKDPNRLYNIYQPLHVSYDGGVSFDPVPMIPADETKGIHADFHAFWVDPNDPTFFIIGGDGGIGITHDHGKAWYFPETIPVAQFYHINVDEDMPYNVYGGMQDNGNWSGPGYVWKRGGIRTLYWQYLVGGDGFIIQPDSVDSRFGYGTSQNGELYRYDKLTGYYQHIQPKAPNMDTRLRYNWNAGFAQDPNNNDVAYHGSQFVHKTTDKGQTWTIISPDLTTNNPDHQKQDYGGLTIDASGAEIYNSIISLAVSYLDKNVIWAGSDDGLVHLTRDGGRSWTNVTANIKGLPKQAWLAQMQTSPHKAGEVWLVANNYRQGDYAPYLYRTQDFGKTWVRMADASQVKGYALSVMPDTKEPKLVFLGTENGLWISIDEGKNWEQFKNGFPSVSTMDMAIQQRESALIVGTFGRAIWVLDDLLSLRKLAVGKLEQSPLTALPVNDAVQVKGLFINPPGNIWTGFYTTFEGANKPFQKVEIPFFVKDNNAGDKAMAEVYNAGNQLIQTVNTDSVVAGLNYITWKLDEQMARLPGAWVGEGSRDIPVLPGDYSIKIKYGDNSSETTVKVIPDPRFEYNEEVDRAVYTLSKRLNMSTEKLSSAMSRLQASDKTIEHVLTQAKAVTAKEVVTASESIQQKIKALNDMGRASRPDKQVGAWQSFAVTATSKMSDAAQALRGRLFVPTSQDVKVIEEAEQLVGDFVKAVDSFYVTEWPAYKKQVEEAKLSWFRE